MIIHPVMAFSSVNNKAKALQTKKRLNLKGNSQSVASLPMFGTTNGTSVNASNALSLHKASSALGKVLFGYQVNAAQAEALEDAPIAFNAYVDMAKANPKICRNPFQLLYDMIIAGGTGEGVEHGKKVVTYNIFTNPKDHPELEISGNSKPIQAMVNYFKLSSKGWGAKTKLLLNWGPHGTAKTTAISCITIGLEDYTKTEEGKIFTFRWNNLPKEILEALPTGLLPDALIQVDGSIPDEMNSDPLLLIPPDVRDKEEKALVGKMELAPLSQTLRDALIRKYMKEIKKENPELNKAKLFQKAMEKMFTDNVQVHRLYIDQSRSKGVGLLPPQNPKSIDDTQFTGGTNYTNLGQIGNEGDARVYQTKGGAALDGTRGLTIINEICKMLPDGKPFFVRLLAALQEGKVTPSKMRSIDISTCFIADSNPPEVKRMKADVDLKPFKDRLEEVRWPYLLDYTNEIGIYKKMLGIPASAENIFLGKGVLEAIAKAMVLSRFVAPKSKDGMEAGDAMLEKLHIYAGKAVEPDVIEGMLSDERKAALKKDPKNPILAKLDDLMVEGAEKDEGMFGFSPRTGDKIGQYARVHEFTEKTQSIDALLVLETLKNAVRYNSLELGADDLKKLATINLLLEKEINKSIIEDCVEAMAENENELELHYSEYIQGCLTFDTNKEKTAPKIKEALESIEKYLPADTRRDIPGFRSTICKEAGKFAMKQYPYTYKSENGSPILKRAVRDFVAESNKKNQIKYAHLLEKASKPEFHEELTNDPIIKALVTRNGGEDYKFHGAIRALQKFSELEQAGQVTDKK